MSELMLLVAGGALFFVPSSIIICGLFGYLMMGVGIGLLLVIAGVVAGATILQKLKRGRPQGYYQLRLRLWLEDLRLIRPSFIRQGRIWDVGRRGAK